MITFTNDVMDIFNGLDRIIRAEFPTLEIAIQEDFDEDLFGSSNQLLKLWLDNEDHLGNFSNGEDKLYFVSANYYIRDTADIDLLTLEKNYTDFGQRFDRLLNNNKAYRYGGSTVWHTLNISGSSMPLNVINDDGEIYPGLKNILRELEIYRGNHFA